MVKTWNLAEFPSNHGAAPWKPSLPMVEKLLHCKNVVSVCNCNKYEEKDYNGKNVHYMSIDDHWSSLLMIKKCWFFFNLTLRAQLICRRESSYINNTLFSVAQCQRLVLCLTKSKEISGSWSSVHSDCTSFSAPWETVNQTVMWLYNVSFHQIYFFF